ncbi:hypothetical protein [Streptomyces monashensis]|uniref:CHRD domain-containing protein n=1 Tax=Streptomyces monashensis TaxID=1678012 RepID=A0A1S2Q136_9ACTN|nr:hypothetical protein [Streptomyces monashensis]OIJ99456.1 hypothetical protein BIV23_28120 [Streptomyces monashensis]
MRRSRIAGTALVGVGLVAFGGAAFAAGPVGTVSPAKVKAGQSVHLTLAGCSKPREGGRAEGPSVETIDLTLKVTGTLVGTARIDPGTRPGVAHIHLACASDPDAVATVDVTVVD